MLIAAFENPWCSCLFNMDGAVKMIGMELACRWTDNSNGMPPWLPPTACSSSWVPAQGGRRQTRSQQVPPTGTCFGRTIHPGSSESYQHLGECRGLTPIRAPAQRCPRKERPQREPKLYHLLMPEISLRNSKAFSVRHLFDNLLVHSMNIY